MSFNDILTQVFQPYFYYSLLFLVTSFVCVKVFNRYCHFLNPKTKSLLYLIPLGIPLAVMAVYLPQLTIQTVPQVVSTGTLTTTFASGVTTYTVVSGVNGILLTVSPATVLSITGLLCIVGLLVADVFFVVMVAVDDRLARRFLHVISISSDEYPSLHKTVANLSQKMHIITPQIGVVEDLRPNAYTIGYGKRATVVFSMGLLNILNDEEVTAVASHELAHLKNSDFFYKLLSSTLTVVSFFNPIAYVTSSAAQREREMLADQESVNATGTPNALSSALAKICKTLTTMPKQGLLVSASSNLLVTSSVIHRLGILSTHPRLDTRLRNISTPNPVQINPRKLRSAVLLSLMMVSVVCMVVYGMANLQTSYANQVKPITMDYSGNAGPMLMGSFSASNTVNATVGNASGGMFVGNANFGVQPAATGLTTTMSGSVVNSSLATGAFVGLPSVSGVNSTSVVTPNYFVPVTSGFYRVSSP